MAYENLVKSVPFSGGKASIRWDMESTVGSDGKVYYFGGMRIVNDFNQVFLGAQTWTTSTTKAQAKEGILKSLQSSLRTDQRNIQNNQEEIQKYQAELAALNPNETGYNLKKRSIERSIAELTERVNENKSDAAAAQAAIADINATFDSTWDSLVQKVTPPPQPPPKPAETPTNATSQTDAAAPAKEADPATGNNPPSGSAPPQTSGGGQAPATTGTDSKGENAVNDDTKIDAKSGENQSNGVVPNPTNPTNTAQTGGGSGTQASPGGTGTSGKNIKPGRRLKNPLSYFSSSTYNITLYMITPDAYDAFVQSGRRNINALASATVVSGEQNEAAAAGAGAFIICQSGGINDNVTKRAPGFELDYYIDNLKIKTATSGKSTQSATNVTEMSFNVLEPYGFSFITNLKRASNALTQYSKNVNYKNLSNASKQFFILGLRFYGYDQNGNLLTGKNIKDGEPLDPNTTENNVFEAFYDIALTSIKFKLDGKSVRYDITATSVATLEAWGFKRGRVKSDTTVEGETVLDCLTGPKGLLTQLNKQQQDQVGKEITFPNTYQIKWADADAEAQIGKAGMVLASDLDKNNFPMADSQTTSDSTDANTPAPNPTKRILKFAQDVSILQATSQLISRSRYLEKALKTIHKVAAQPDPKKKEREIQDNPDKAIVSWFNISAELSNPKFDPKTNDWAYTITYIISIYETPIITNAYSYPGSRYYGPHKRYEYWFSGQNSEIIEYSQNFDNTYFTVALAPDQQNGSADPALPRAPATAPENAATQGGQVAISPNNAQGGDTTGVGGTLGSEAQNAYVTSLYDPGAYASARVKILGDPDFLIQESATSQNQLYNRYYGTNQFTIGANGGQVFVEIDFKEAFDYKYSKGLMEINDSILFFEYPPDVRQYIKGVSYLVRDVVSTFSGGSFTQDLVMDLNTFANPPGDIGIGYDDNLRDVPPATAPPANTPASTTGPAPGDSTSTTRSTGLTANPPVPADPKASLPALGNATP